MSIGRVALWVLFFCQPLLSLAGDWPEQRHIQVSGMGEVEAVPDMARIGLRISQTGRDSAAAKRQVDSLSDAVLAVARRQGLDEKAIRAAQIRVSPEYNWEAGKRELRGYRVERQIQLTLKDLDRYSVLVDALVKAGVTHIDGVQFDLKERDRLQREALKLALADARAKAETLAASAGRQLEGLYRVVESGTHGPPVPMLAMRGDRAEAAPEMPVGMQTLRASLTAVYLLQ